MPRTFKTAPVTVTQILMACAILTQSCRQDPRPDEGADTSELATTIKVVTTTGMIADLVRSIGGDAVVIKNLVGVGVDPHLYKPTRDDITEILSSQIVFFNGLHLEGRMGEILERASEDRPTIAVGETIPKDDLLFPDGIDNYPDPHLWLSPRVWGMCSESILDGLIGLRPEASELFRANHERLLKQCDDMESYGQRPSIRSPGNRGF